jgi:hypothetical protein
MCTAHAPTHNDKSMFQTYFNTGHDQRTLVAIRLAACLLLTCHQKYPH